MEKTANRSVLKTLEFLEYFIDNTELSLAELVELSQMPKSTVFRIIQTLEMRGFISKTANHQPPKYQLGLKLLEFGNIVAQRLEIRKIALPYMLQLRDNVEEAVNLIIRDQDEGVYIEKVDTRGYVRVYTQVGRRAPLYAGACPRILLSFMPDEEITAFLKRVEWKKIAPGTNTDEQLLWKWIHDARERGYTVSYGELEPDSAALAVPIRDFTGQVIAGLSLAGATSRFTEERLGYLIQETKAAAKSIMSQLGYTESITGK
ncbi:IclR family transcriptional regulator [Bacillus thuringiensis]|nr:IclR family transcriptional regulator [Bacillus thuringiensis]